MWRASSVHYKEKMRHLFLVAAALVALAAPSVALADTESTDRSSVPGPVRSFDPDLIQLANGNVVYCWASDFWVQRQRRSTVGILLWYYRLTIDDFCWGNNKIVLANAHRNVGGPFVPCWDFAGHLDNQVNWNAKWSRVQTIEGKFQWALPAAHLQSDARGQDRAAR
jgi:hypothetical protein